MEDGLKAGIQRGIDVGVELALVDAAANGDTEAFAALYDRHLDRVYRYVRYWIADTNEAEDLTQQVFLQAWRAIRNYRRSEAPFAAWLVKIAHNQVVSFFRKARQARPLDENAGYEERPADPEAEALTNEARAAVRKAILRLRPEQQQVVIMRFIEHMGYAEIAAILGKSEGNVRVIQHRALRELRRILSQETIS